MIKNRKIFPEFNRKVLVAMSGGVDSSTAALILKKKGFRVIGIFFNLGQKNYKESLKAVREVAQKIGIRIKIIDLRGQFQKEIIDYFLKSYEKGLTPNPCVVCNQKIKFAVLFKLAERFKADYIATGHYARLQRNFKYQILNFKNLKLRIARDSVKDQSYFLYTLTQRQLAKILFPLGEYTKEEVRKLADKEKLPYLKKESQDICFLMGDHNEFLKQNLKFKKGLIVNTERQVVGQHEGLPLYTLGQRRAVKIGGIGPFYVTSRDFKKNRLIVTDKFNDSILYSDKLVAEKVNWISGKLPKLPLHCQARIRYLHPLENCSITKAGKNYLVKFEKPLRAITPGQSVVFYQKDEVLGGGIIKI